MNGPCLAAITFAPQGGGVAAVSRLMADVIRQRWGDHIRLVTLLDEESARRSLPPSRAAQLRFGADVALLQLAGRCEWTFYTHLSIARVQTFLPGMLTRPYGVFLHGIEVWSDLTPSQRKTLLNADLRVANSSFTASRVAQAHPDIGPIEACPLSLPPNHVSTAEVRDGSPYAIGPTAVLLVARMAAGERYKGHDQLLEAWPDVLQRVPGAQLILVGDGDDLPRLKAKAQAIGVGDAAIFTGFVPDTDLRALYQRAAVFAMPSRGEGFGLVYLEAMSHALPCIGSVEDAASEIIEDGQTGFLVAQADRAALVDRIVRLLGQESLRRQLGAAGRRRLEERFSYARFSRRILSLIESTLTPRRRHYQSVEKRASL